MGENYFSPMPMALYGGVLLMATIAHFILERTIIASQGADSLLAKAVGRDIKGKISPLLYAMAIPMAFYKPWISTSIYALVALIWLVLDRKHLKIPPPTLLAPSCFL